MSDTEEQSLCQTCSDFEPQTWRKSLCKNCFHSLDEHSHELLAHEAEVVAKEKAASKLPEHAKANPETGTSIVETAKEITGKEAKSESTSEKGDTQRKVQRKYGAERAAAEGGGKWSWAIDLGRGYSKSNKPSPTDTTKVASASSSTPAPTSSTKPSPQTSAKPSLKPTPPEESASTTVSTAVSSETTPVSTSKAKNFASKFESKAQALSKSKPTSKSPEIRSGSASVAALTGKLTDIAPGTKTHTKAAELQKPSSSKPDSKDTKYSEATSRFSKTVSATVKDNDTDASKNIKPTLQTGKFDDKSSSLPTGSQPKVALFGKDMLKSTKDASKRESVTLSSVKKPESVTSSGRKADISSSCVEKADISSSSVEKADISSSCVEKAESSSTSITKTGSSIDETPTGSLAISVEKPESSSDSSLVKPEKPSTSSLEIKMTPTESKISETTEGKQSVKSSCSEELLPLLLEKDNSVADSKSVSKKEIDDGKKVKEESVPDGDKTAEVGQRSLRTDISQAGNVAYSARHSEHASISTLHSSGYVASCTGSGLDVKKAEDSGKESVHASTNKDDVTGEGQDDEGADLSLPSDSKLSDSAPRLSQEEETIEVGKEKYKSDTTTSVSPSPTSRETTTTTASKFTTSATASRDSKPASSVSHSTTPTSSLDIKSRSLPPDAVRDYKSDLSPVEKFNDLNKTTVDNEGSQLPITYSTSSPLTESGQKDESPQANTKEDAKEKSVENANNDVEKLIKALEEKDDELSNCVKQLSKMEEQVKVLEQERDQLKRTSTQTQKEDLEALLTDLRSQLAKMEEQCSRLERENQSLIDKLREQEARVRRDQECRGKNSDNVDLEEDLEAAEKELEDVKEENKELQSHIMEMKNEMDEMYDHFRENEHDEFRELEKELDITAKNCRILQIKLRKAERRNEQIEQDRLVYEEKLRVLQDQFDSQDAKNHIRLLEEELRMAKEVSVRLHDELDLLDDKRNKALEESRHLTELLEHTDKRQFRMEMEIDKLRDVVSDLKQQLKEAKSGNNNKESTPDRKVLSSIYSRSIE